MTPGEAVRKFCLDCVGSAHEVHTCGGDKCLSGGADKNGFCFFYRYRLGKGRPSVKTIRKVCLWCMGGDVKMVRECPGDSDEEGVRCELWPYRLGRNPARSGIGGGIEKRRVSSQIQAQNRLSHAGQGVTSSAHSQGIQPGDPGRA